MTVFQYDSFLRLMVFVFWILRRSNPCVSAFSPLRISHNIVAGDCTIITCWSGVTLRTRFLATTSDYQTPDFRNSDNLFQEWTQQDDQMLWENRNLSTSALAILLGRGLRGVETRIAKLKDVDSQAYQRLFASIDTDPEEATSKKKLVPASEVLRRIRWDARLPSNDFTVQYYDRVEDKVQEIAFHAPNDSIPGKSRNFVDALPEHRIVAIKYKERVVWDRPNRIDLVFSNEGIERLIAEYAAWKMRRDEEKELSIQRQADISRRVRQTLGSERFDVLVEQLGSLVTASLDQTVSTKLMVEKFVRSSLELFKTSRNGQDIAVTNMTDEMALDLLSEFVASFDAPETLRSMVLDEIKRSLGKEESKVFVSALRELPELNEIDLSEKFVRGSGPGGQKINKTSIRVVLVHLPTQLRVECQDTRSLQQNRKIARKRMRLKLDEHLNGSQSRTQQAAEKAAIKKAKASARSRVRQNEKRNNEHDV